MKKLTLFAILFIASCSTNNQPENESASREAEASVAAGGAKYKRYTIEQFYTGNWGDAVQKAIDSACIKGIPLYSSGTYNCGTRVLKFPKFFKEITWHNDRAVITCGGITRDRPLTLAESQQQQNTKFNLYDLYLNGNGTGTGLETAANSNSIFQNITIDNFNTAAIFRTTQHGYFSVITMGGNVNGLFFDCETNNGISASGTQSNDNKVFQPRFHSNLACGTTISVKGSFGFDCWGLESEGNGSIMNVIDFDDLGNPTVKSIRFYEPHFEHTQGIRAGGAFAKVKLNQGVFYMSDPNHDVGAQSNMILVDATACGSGSEILLEDVNKWEHSGIIFKGSQTHWGFYRGAAIVQFSANNNPTVQKNIQGLFAAPIPDYAVDKYNNDPKVWGTNTFNWTMF